MTTPRDRLPHGWPPGMPRTGPLNSPSGQARGRGTERSQDQGAGEYALVHDVMSDRPRTVCFRLAHPADAHEALLKLTLSRAAWASQGSPEEITMGLATAVGW